MTEAVKMAPATEAAFEAEHSKGRWWVAAVVFSIPALALIFLACDELMRRSAPWASTHPNMAAWIQAAGSLLAIFATALIAIFDSRRSRRQLDAQMELQREAIKTQLDMQTAAFNHQLVLQRELIAHQVAAEKDRIAGDRRRAIISLTSAHGLLMAPARLVKLKDTSLFHKIYKPDIDRAKFIVDNVGQSCFDTETEHNALAALAVNVSDFDAAMASHMADVDDPFYVALVKRKVNTYALWLRILDKDSKVQDIALHPHEEELLKPREQRVGSNP